MNRWAWLLISGAMFGLACAQPEAASQRARPAMSGAERPLIIDLEPRCASIASHVPLDPPAEIANGAGRVTRRILRDEIEGWSIETPYASRDSLSWGFPAGRRIDPAHLELAAALLRAGATTPDPADFRQRVSRMSGRLEVHVEEEWIWLELFFPASELATALDLLMEWQNTGAVEEAFFEATVRSTNLARLATESDAAHIAQRAFERLQPSANPAAKGTHADEEPTPDSFARLLDSALGPVGSVLLHSQSNESIAAAARVAAAFARLDIPPAKTSASTRSGEPARRNSDLLLAVPGTLYVVDRAGAPQVEILVGHPTVAPEHPDTPALEMLASLLGGDVGGRLFRDLRERHGLAYIINAVQSPDARFVVSTRARPERVARLVQGIEDHLEALVRMPLEPCEIATIEARMRGEEFLARDNAGGLRAQFRKDIAKLGVPTNSEDRVARYAQAAREGLVSVAREHLAGEAIIILVGEADRLRRDLKSAFPERRVRVFEPDLGSLRAD